MPQIRELYPSDLQPLLEELKHQRQVDAYNELYRFAFLASVFANVNGNKTKPEDFISEPPRRQAEVASSLDRAIAAAKAKGVNVPDAGR